MVLDEGITLHGEVRNGHKKDGDYSAAIKSCLFTRYSLKFKRDQNRFWELLPTTFRVYKQATVTNGDRVCAADHQAEVEEDTDWRDTTFVRVSGYHASHIPLHSIPCSTRYLEIYTRTCEIRTRFLKRLSTLGN